MSLRDNLKVMVVDDTSVSRKLIVQAIEAMGVKSIETTRDGQSALKSMISSPVHLVVSDHNMPGMTGIELLRAMRSKGPTAKTAFILITGRPERSVIEEGKKLGMHNFLPKPFTPKDMKKCIEAVVGPV